MPGLMTYRTLASATRANRAHGSNALVWTKSGKKLEEGPPVHAQAKAGGPVLPLQMPPAFQPFQVQVKRSSNLKREADLLYQIKQTGMYGEALLNVDRRSHPSSSSSGSEHDELSSVCLAEMVHDFMEDESSRLCNCGRTRCSCNVGNANNSDLFSVSPDESKSGLGGDQVEILKEFVSGISEIENALLAEVNVAIAAVKDQGVDLCDEGIDCTSGCFKRAVMNYLRAVGCNAAICKSRWEHAVGFTGGQYEYIDVIEICNGVPQRLIIDIQFRAQFEIARPTEQYSALLRESPSVFVGTSGRLLQIVNVMCDAMKKSLRKNGMHLPPWRKSEYMKSKWFSPYKRTTNATGQHSKNRDNALNQDCQLQPALTVASSLQDEKAELNGDDMSMMLTDWQPPLVIGRETSNKTMKIAGLASALMEAGLTTLTMEHNTAINYENNFATTAKRAVTAA